MWAEPKFEGGFFHISSRLPLKLLKIHHFPPSAIYQSNLLFTFSDFISFYVFSFASNFLPFSNGVYFVNLNVSWADRSVMCLEGSFLGVLWDDNMRGWREEESEVDNLGIKVITMSQNSINLKLEWGEELRDIRKLSWKAWNHTRWSRVKQNDWQLSSVEVTQISTAGSHTNLFNQYIYRNMWGDTF